MNSQYILCSFSSSAHAWSYFIFILAFKNIFARLEFWVVNFFQHFLEVGTLSSGLISPLSSELLFSSMPSVFFFGSFQDDFIFHYQQVWFFFILFFLAFITFLEFVNLCISWKLGKFLSFFSPNLFLLVLFHPKTVFKTSVLNSLVLSHRCSRLCFFFSF